MTEHDEQCALFEWAAIAHPEQLRWMFAIPNGGVRDRITAARMKQEGVKAGVWDIFLPVPSQGYNGLFIEMKYGKNRLTDEQKEFGDHVSKQGYCTAVAYSAEEAIEIIDDYLSL